MRLLNSATAVATLILGLFLLLPSAGQAGQTNAERAVQRGLQRLVDSPGGPAGAIATLRRPGHTTVLSAGRSDARRKGKPRAGDHMRIASIAKAFSGAVALRLVRDGRLRLDDTIGKWRPEMPEAWKAVTVRQMLNHTSGLPDYTKSEGFFKQAETRPRSYVKPVGIIDWVRAKDLVFTPGSKYEYSNTDNIVVGLIAEKVTGKPYERLLQRFVFRPAKLRQTSFPTRRISLPRPFIHGYAPAEKGVGPDLTTFLSPSGAWASGAIVSTPRNLNTFIRSYLGLRFFDRAQQRQQMRFVPGSSSPPGPGVNSAGLALFRYKSRCGTVYGHTGNFPGYVQWAASTRNGKRSVTTSLNIPAPTGKLLRQLREVQAKAVCALLGKGARGPRGSSSRAGTQPDVIQVSKRGVQSIGDLVITRGYESTDLNDAAAVFGKPGKIRRPYREVCEAYFGKGLQLDFVSFGGESRCYYRLLNSGTIRSRHWKVKVGSRIYRVGQPKRRIPRNAPFFKGLGYRLSTIRGPYGPTGSAYASVGGKNRIRSLRIYVGLAGD